MKNILLTAALLAVAGSASASVMPYSCYVTSKEYTSPAFGVMMSFAMAQGEGAYDVEGKVYNFEPDGKYTFDHPAPAQDGSVLKADDSNKVMAFTITDKKGNKSHYACYALTDQDSTGAESYYAFKYLGGKK
ncbi:hypothetical protein ACU6YP_13640 [Klebsiella aerogenes]